MFGLCPHKWIVLHYPMPSTPAEILATPAHAYRGWRLHARCAGCRNYSIVAIADLPDRLHSLTVAEIIIRLVCKRCGAKYRVPSSCGITWSAPG